MLRHLSPLGLQVNWEKSKLLPLQMISFLSMELDSVRQTARLTQERAQSLLNCLKTLSGSPILIISEAPGAHDSRCDSSSARSAPFETASALASKVGVATRYSPGSDYTSLNSLFRARVPLEQVSRHAVVFTDTTWCSQGSRDSILHSQRRFNGHAVSGVWTGP